MQRTTGENQGRCGIVKICPTICQFSMQDFIPGSEEPNPYLRQSIGEYLLLFYNYREERCPFTKPPTYLRQMSLETGCSLPNSNMSPSDHIRVDKRAFPRDVHVHVKLAVLGYDPRLQGDLQHLKRLVVDQYYQEITGSPMFNIDFGGIIDFQEVCVCDILAANSDKSGGALNVPYILEVLPTPMGPSNKDSRGWAFTVSNKQGYIAFATSMCAPLLRQ